MSFKKQAALLLGAACLSIVLVLSWKHLNKKGASIPEPDLSALATNMSWDKVLENEISQVSLPETILTVKEGRIDIPHKDTASLRHSVEFCKQNSYTGIAAFFQQELAGVSDQPADWEQAGHSIYTYAVGMEDTLRRDFLMAEAIRCFDVVLKHDENNKQATLYKGLALADRRETMMLAVPFLLTVVRSDSTNIIAQYTLGLLAIESGQLDKALVRFQKLISLQPSNAEYHYQAARVEEMLGNKEAALEHYNKSLELTEDPAIQARLKEIIKQLK